MAMRTCIKGREQMVAQRLIISARIQEVVKWTMVAQFTGHQFAPLKLCKNKASLVVGRILRKAFFIFCL
jgi:hypothetical protein